MQDRCWSVVVLSEAKDPAVFDKPVIPSKARDLPEMESPFAGDPSLRSG